eukprot:CAMPEP_0177752152 /NCGR_PEP_ID=MMETSP0491_2-20121128/764_1 /TAXON_ID=63592 /ORGANISM="Tetraselmis chuii, Strain PLY429" /LENGTH=295 /DNA_ID=CAMNT_0019267331 /DNA_START=72 /DNA_END=959 /DNA_ORIENTATION=+
MSTSKRPVSHGADADAPQQTEVRNGTDGAEGSTTAGRQSTPAVLWSRALLLAVLGAALLVQYFVQSDPTLGFFHEAKHPERRAFTQDELSKFTGAGDTPIYISILGQVFDVTKGRRHYGPGQAYSVFAGRDASRSFITGEFEGQEVRSDVTGLEPQEMKGLLEWRGFYHETYVFKGYLADSLYYDGEGEPKALLAEVARGAKEAERLEAIRKANRKKHPPCNMKWTAAEGGQVWCNEGYPRLLVEYEESLLPKDGQARKAKERCACFETVGWSDLRKVYKGCKPDAQSCKVVKST